MYVYMYILYMYVYIVYVFIVYDYMCVLYIVYIYTIYWYIHMYYVYLFRFWVKWRVQIATTSSELNYQYYPSLSMSYYHVYNI